MLANKKSHSGSRMIIKYNSDKNLKWKTVNLMLFVSRSRNLKQKYQPWNHDSTENVMQIIWFMSVLAKECFF